MGSSFFPAIGALERPGVASPDNAWSLEPLDARPSGEAASAAPSGRQAIEVAVQVVRLPGPRAA